MLGATYVEYTRRRPPDYLRLRKVPHRRDRFAKQEEYSTTKRLSTSLDAHVRKPWTRGIEGRPPLSVPTDMLSATRALLDYSSIRALFASEKVNIYSSVHLFATGIQQHAYTTAAHVVVDLFDSLLGISSYHTTTLL